MSHVDKVVYGEKSLVPKCNTLAIARVILWLSNDSIGGDPIAVIQFSISHLLLQLSEENRIFGVIFYEQFITKKYIYPIEDIDSLKSNV